MKFSKKVTVNIGDGETLTYTIDLRFLLQMFWHNLAVWFWGRDREAELK